MRRLLTSGIFVVFCFLTVVSLAQVPQLLNYQGRLTDDRGIPIITPTTVRFSLYQGGDAATPLSGTLCYQEDASVTPDDNGVFSHLIGSGTVIYGALDATVFQTASPVFLEIAIDPAGANETLLPRKQIVTVGYSFKAEVAELADDADTVDGQDASAFSPVVHNHDPDYVNEGQANSVTSSMIVDGTIVDADINAGANIAGSKINSTGLDADLLDGKDSLEFVHTAGDDMTGTLNVTSPGGYAVYGSAPIHGVYGISTNTTGTNWGVCGEGVSPGAWGVFGTAPTYGVYGLATATSGTAYGVYGESASASGRGVFGQSPTQGVHGHATATSGLTYGVYGTTASTNGRGVSGFATATEGTTYGVYGTTASTSDYAFASGVYGEATATSGTNSGVYGTTASSGPWASGVYGEATSTSGGTGVHAKSNSPNGYGVYAMAPNHPIIGYATADSGPSTAVEATSNSSVGYGVFATAPYCGVYGSATAGGNTHGVWGRSDSSYGTGVYGEVTASSGSNFGVVGSASSASGYGVYGHNNSGGYAGYFMGKTHVQGTFTSSDKRCIQEIENGKKVTLFVMESPEYWFEDFGTGKLVNGRAVVQLERGFAQTVNTGVGYYVFLTPNGECQGLYIFRKDTDSFEVQELGGGTSSISFDYRIVAKRRGYEMLRLEEFTEPEQPPAEQKLPIEKKAANLKQPQSP